MSVLCYWRYLRIVPVQLLIGAVLIVAICRPVSASTSCVNPGGTFGCFSTISAATAASLPNETIKVFPGTYSEDVIIAKPLSLVGSGPGNTIVDAAGLANGIYVDGLDHPGLKDVVVTGFTVENANFEGVLVANASSVTIWNNHMVNNDKALSATTGQCTGLPSFETDDSFDCGGGLHLTGVNHSTVTGNIFENNADGLLMSDDTGETNDNLIAFNISRENPFDCGIVLASHPPGPGSTAAHFGIVHNTLAFNESIHNGFQVPGAGAGIGVFSDGTGPGRVSGNVIMFNELKNNGLPGVAFHSHVGPLFGLPPDNLNDNVIVGNHISGNGQDLFDTPTPGPAGININSGGGGTPITGTIISGNVIENEAIDVAVNTPAEVDLHLNSLLGDQIGVDNLGTGAINAAKNWWGCRSGPGSGSAGCSTVSGNGIIFTPWLTRRVE